jgi:hypothetical protein
MCPAGWHIPTDNEQFLLENYLKDPGATCDANRPTQGDCNGAGARMKSGTPLGLNYPMGGHMTTDGVFHLRGTSIAMWSSSQVGTDAWYRYVTSYESNVYRYQYPKETSFSVRCLQDSTVPSSAITLTASPDAGYINQGVEPNFGSEDTTDFQLKFVYTDSSGMKPTGDDLIVIIKKKTDGVLAEYGRVSMTPDLDAGNSIYKNGDTIDGEQYVYSTKLPAGEYTYHFEVKNSDARYPKLGEGELDDGEGGVFTSLIVQQPQCSDGIDNDGDGEMDLGDLGCANAQDDDENSQPTVVINKNNP